MRSARDAAHPVCVRVIAILRRGIAGLLLAGVAACLALSAQARAREAQDRDRRGHRCNLR